MIEDTTVKKILDKLRRTQGGNSAAAIRILLGVLFLMTGVMKFVVPELRAAFSGQLAAAGIPFHSLNMWIVPAVEICLGALLLAGLFTRLSAMVAITVMAVATYVHLIVHDPTLFPLQPEAPIVPLIAIVLSLYLLRAGGGSLSLDLRASDSSSV
jgi:uncharacterized membrane protein YphA (DoxX/SURF4 family)